MTITLGVDPDGTGGAGSVSPATRLGLAGDPEAAEPEGERPAQAARTVAIASIDATAHSLLMAAR
jgi:hypothetical protein